jgi:PAS domain S-box-containing protein
LGVDPTRGSDARFLGGGGNMGALICTHDWSASPLGALHTWPQSLRSAVQICLSMPVAAAVLWGPGLRILYNDTYAPALGERHPWALGRAFGEVCGDVSDVFTPQIASVFETGRGFSTEPQLVRTHRDGRLEDTYRIYSFAPLHNDGGAVAGIFVTALDSSDRAVTEPMQPDQSFTRLFQASPAPFLVLAPDAPRFTIRAVNEAYLAATMTTRESIVGRGVFEAFPDNPNDPEIKGVSTLRASLERVLATREPDTLPGLKYDVARPDGSFEERWWSPVNSAVLDERGEVEALIHNANDVTDERRALAALRASEARLREVNETLTKNERILDALVRSSSEVRFRLNPDWSTLHQLNGGDFIPDATDDTNWLDRYIPPQDRDAVRAEIARSIRTKSTYAIEHRVNRVGGTVGWALSRAVPLLDDQGEITEWFGAASDITARKAAEDALGESEARLRTLMEGIPQLVWRSCEQGLWTWSSRQWQEFTGRSQEESGGLGWLDVVHPEDHEMTISAWQEARPHGMLDVEYRVRRAADGAWLWHHTRSVPVRDPSGRIVEWLGTTTDVHTLRELHQRQEVLVAELQHRTRNLITVVGALSDRTVRNAASLEDFRERFGSRLAALSRVQGLLSQLAAGDRVAFDELLRSELAALGAFEDKAKLVTLEGPNGLPLRSTSVQTFALALHELATNAVKYGALSASAPNGHLSVRWHVVPATSDNPPLLHLDWQESGVSMPQLGAPVRGGGYGRELIERALPYQLGAKTTYEMRRDGVHCSIEVPISRGE